jgi:hypothetical protein
MDYRIVLDRYGRWQERWRDPMLTGLLVLLALEVFLGLPLLRAPYLDARLFAIAWLLMVIAAVLVATRHWIAVTAILVSSAIALVTNITRISDPTTLTICMGSGSVLLFMGALTWIIWSAVFGPGIRAWFTIASAHSHPRATGISYRCTLWCGVCPILSQ